MPPAVVLHVRAPHAHPDRCPLRCPFRFRARSRSRRQKGSAVQLTLLYQAVVRQFSPLVRSDKAELEATSLPNVCSRSTGWGLFFDSALERALCCVRVVQVDCCFFVAFLNPPGQQGFPAAELSSWLGSSRVAVGQEFQLYRGIGPGVLLHRSRTAPFTPSCSGWNSHSPGTTACLSSVGAGKYMRRCTMPAVEPGTTDAVLRQELSYVAHKGAKRKRKGRVNSGNERDTKTFILFQATKQL